MNIPFIPRSLHNGVFGKHPTLWAGFGAVDGDAANWLQQRVGSLYAQIDRTNNLLNGWWVKQKAFATGLDDDWGPVNGVLVLSETVAYNQFTDGGGASGTYTMKQAIPAGAVALRTRISNIVGFTGNVSATIIVGDGSDTDRYMTGTPSVFTTAAQGVDAGVVSGTAWHTAAINPVITVTASSDFTLVTAGRVTVKIFAIY